MSETELSASIRNALEQLGCWVERLQSGKHKVRGGWVHCCSPGTPDLMLLSPIQAFIEVKLPGEKLRPEQEAWHARARRCGHQVVVLTSVSGAIEMGKIWIRMNGNRDWDAVGLGT